MIATCIMMYLTFPPSCAKWKNESPEPVQHVCELADANGDCAEWRDDTATTLDVRSGRPPIPTFILPPTAPPIPTKQGRKQ